MKKTHRFAKQMLLDLSMLLLTLGTAFADGTPATTLPTPSFTPPSGSTLQPGTKITFDIPAEAQSAGGVYLFYTMNEPDIPLQAEYTTLMTAMETLFQGWPFNVAVAQLNENEIMEWKIPCIITEKGQVTLRARLAIPVQEQPGDDPSDPGTGHIEYSPIITATYTVEGDIARPSAPTFSPTPGELALNSDIRISSPYGDEDPFHMIWYASGNIADEDFDISTYEDLMALEDEGKLKQFSFETPIKFKGTVTMKAAVFELNISDLSVLRSDIVAVSYWPAGSEEPVVEVGAPKFSPDGGAVKEGSSVRLSTTTVSAKIYYTTDGSEPTVSSTEYTTPIVIDKDMTIKAIAFFGSKSQSNLSEKSFTIKEDEPVIEVAEPTFSVPAGEVEKGTPVTVTCATKDAKIHYTVDGSEPTAQSAEFKTAIVIDETLTLKAIAMVGENKSSVAEATYTVKEDNTDPTDPTDPVDTVATPTFSVPAGEVEKGTPVTVTCATKDAKIHYTVDGSEPTAQSAEFKAAIVIDETMTLKAMAMVGEKKSSVAEAAYTVKEDNTDPTDPVDTVATPTFSVPAGEVEKGTPVTMTCATKDAKIHYTVDGSEPTAQSAEFKAAIVIDETMTLKAIAIVGEKKSLVATATYTVKDVANEALELAGVNVYPNPSAGEFTLNLPVAATVEVFAANGMLRQRMNADAGNVTLHIDRSGVYFLRVTASGHTTVKRVVVR